MAGIITMAERKREETEEDMRSEEKEARGFAHGVA